MTYGWRLPLIAAKLPEPARPRRRVAIPGMQQAEKGHQTQFPDEVVVRAILSHLNGRTYARIAEDINANENTVRHWCEGTMRRLCLIEAERRFKDQLRAE